MFNVKCEKCLAAYISFSATFYFSSEPSTLFLVFQSLAHSHQLFSSLVKINSLTAFGKRRGSLSICCPWNMGLKNRWNMGFKCRSWGWSLSLIGTSGRHWRLQPYSNAQRNRISEKKHDSLLHRFGFQRVRLCLLTQSFGQSNLRLKWFPSITLNVPHLHTTLFVWRKEAGMEVFKTQRQINWKSQSQGNWFGRELSWRSWGKGLVMINGCRVKSWDTMIYLRKKQFLSYGHQTNS